ncbi:MAG: hypothetical protein ACI87E_003219 [Mariniblastus sp.]|jgi:hypothetical protein
MHEFVNKQWNDFCNNLERSANHLAGESQNLLDQFMNAAMEFYDNTQPSSYQELLEAIARGTAMVISWQDRSPNHANGPAHAGNGMAYMECENHAPMPMPTETMAKQTEQARSKN